MRLVRKLFDFYLNASIHVALAVVAMVAVTTLEYELNLANELYLFIFFGTLTGYNFVKYIPIAGLNRPHFGTSIRSIRLISIVSFGLSVFYAFQLSISVLGVVGGCALLTFFYAVPLLKKSNLRSLSGLKVFVVALVWAGVTVIIPLVSQNIELNNDLWISFIQRILIVVALTIPFEIRDLQYDISSLRTLPQQMGLKKVKVFGSSLLVIAILLVGFIDDFSWTYLIGLLFVTAMIMVVLFVSDERQSKYFASFWVESIPIFWWLLYCLLDRLF